jgi:hypothetical protein
VSPGNLSVFQILLVDGDADRLKALGAALRERGFDVAEALDPRAVHEASAADRYEILLIAEASHRRGGPELEALLRRRGTPYLVLVGDADSGWTTNEVHHEDVDVIARRVSDVLRLSSPIPVAPTAARTSGSLAEGGLVPLVASFHTNAATGVLSVTTADGAGELRFARGELVDAVFSKLEGVKALFRLAREKEGAWVFTEASPLVMRRITTPTEELLRAAPVELERVGTLRRALGNLEGFAIVAEPTEAHALGALATLALGRLAQPRSLDSLLDESPETDGDVLGAVVEIDGAGLLRRVHTDARVSAFELPEQWNRVAALTAQARAAGFRGPARVVFAGPRASLSILAYAAGRIDEAAGASASLPVAPVPFTIATLRLSDDAAVELVAIPLDLASSPLWPLTIAGAAAVVTLGAEETEPGANDVLRDLCSDGLVPIHDGGSIVPSLDPGSPDHVARLVRVALGAEARE